MFFIGENDPGGGSRKRFVLPGNTRFETYFEYDIYFREAKCNG